MQAIEEETPPQTEEAEEVYTIDTLPDRVKAEVLDRYRYFNVEDFEWWDYVYDQWKEKLEEQGFMEPSVYFSGFCCQGDGACFDIKHFDVKAFALQHKAFFARLFFPNIKRYLDAVDNNITFSIQTNDHHYSHSNTRYITWDYSTGADSADEEIGSRLFEKFEDKVVEIEGYIEDVRTKLSDEIYDDLEKEYWHLTSDESVEESLKANDFEFDEFGDKL